MINQPSLSIVVPVYNKAEFLSETLRSILDQRYRDFELILIDDGSSDQSRSICEAFAKSDDRVIVISQSNQGVSAARNKGLELARGQYIGFVDADDVIAPDMYSRLIGNLEECGADVSAGNMELVRDGKSTGVFTELKSVLDASNAMLAFLAGRLNMSANNKVYRSKLIQGLQFSGSIFEDVGFCFDVLSRAGCVVYDDVPVYRYIVRNNSVSVSKFGTKYIQASTVTARIADSLESSCTAHFRSGQALDIRTNIFLLNLLCVSSESFPEALQSVKSRLRHYRGKFLRNRYLHRRYKAAFALYSISPGAYRASFSLFSRLLPNETAGRV